MMTLAIIGLGMQAFALYLLLFRKPESAAVDVLVEDVQHLRTMVATALGRLPKSRSKRSEAQQPGPYSE